MIDTYVLGSGFGLYGYLPALLQTKTHRPIINERTKNKLISRSELIRYLPLVHVCQFEYSTRFIEQLVIALPPIEQENVVKNIAKDTYLRKVYLEKPVATTPKNAELVLNKLKSLNLEIKVGYLFVYLDWYKKLLTVISQKRNDLGTISIHWLFKAHHWTHDANTWKINHNMGGGALRFYGIHIIAVAAKLGYEKVQSSEVKQDGTGNVKVWCASFKADGMPIFNVLVDTCSTDSLFQVIDSQTGAIATLTEPFEPTRQVLNHQDIRCSILLEHIGSRDDEKDTQWYQDTNKLWQATEDITQFTMV